MGTLEPLNNDHDRIKIAAAKAQGRTEGALQIAEEITRWFGKNTVPSELQRRLDAVIIRFTRDQARSLDEFAATSFAGRSPTVHP